MGAERACTSFQTCPRIRAFAYCSQSVFCHAAGWRQPGSREEMLPVIAADPHMVIITTFHERLLRHTPGHAVMRLFSPPAEDCTFAQIHAVLETTLSKPHLQSHGVKHQCILLDDVSSEPFAFNSRLCSRYV